MAQPLMPKATAVWLVENTSLTFAQIADFCDMHLLEIQAIADAESSFTMTGFDPIASGQLDWEEIKKCENDPQARLKIKSALRAEDYAVKKKGKYTPVSKRQDKPDAIAWLIKFYPDLSDAAICSFLGTTRPTIQSVRQKTHWNSHNIKARSPLQLGLCTEAELEHLIKGFAKADPEQ